jgi:hypothetical protein
MGIRTNVSKKYLNLKIIKLYFEDKNQTIYLYICNKKKVEKLKSEFLLKNAVKFKSFSLIKAEY